MTLPVLFFAAGLGTRMRPLTDARPKPLIEVGGKPLIDHALDFATAAGLCPKVVNLHYMGGMIREHLTGQDIAFSDESAVLLETGGGLRKALPLLGPGPVVTMNTDAVWGRANPFTRLLSAWDPGRMEALVLLIEPTRARGHVGKGDFLSDKAGRLTRGPGRIYSGAQIIRPDALDEIPDARFSLNRVWDKMIDRGTLFGVSYPDLWCDVGQPESLPIAEALLKELP